MSDGDDNQIPDLSGSPIYQNFIENHDDEYERYHIHIIGLVGGDPRSNNNNSDDDENKSNAIDKRRNRFGRPRVVDTIADPYVTVTTTGEDTGSVDYFPIGYHKFSTLQDCQTPLWDAKCVLLGKKGPGTTTGIKFTLMDENAQRADEELFSFTVKKEELPAPTTMADAIWTDFVKTGSDDESGGKRVDSISFHFRIMVTDGADRVVSKDDSDALYQEGSGLLLVEGYSYEEHVVPDDTEDDEDNALLQSWKATENNNSKAVFWVLGRNDCFMHPHVAKALFFPHGYDVFVLNYKQNGRCRRKGWVHDAHYNSHNKHADFDKYIGDIGRSLDIVGDGYEALVGYAHSTGGPILLNYLMERGDSQFDAFIFNSPFLEWGYVGGDLVEFVLKNISMLEKMSSMSTDTKVGIATTPEGCQPVTYLSQEIVLCDWASKLWSMYYFDWSSRPLYKVPMTVGFASGVTAVHKKLESFHRNKKAVTAKPFLCITSRGDDVLKADETLSRADWIGPGRWEIELNDNGHDVFLSHDPNDTEMAIDMVQVWMKNQRLL